MPRIVDIFVGILKTRLEARKTTIDYSLQALDYLADKGYSGTYGARLLKRLIRKEIEDILADSLLFGDLQNGGRVWVGTGPDDKGRTSLSISFNEAADAEKAAATPAAAVKTPMTAPVQILALNS